MRILSIETSCDETALSVIETEGDFPANKIAILANRTISQIDIHKEFGGVFPAVAKREHAKSLVPLLVTVLKDANLYTKTSRHVVPHPLSSEFEQLLEREPQLYSQFIDTIPHIDNPHFDAIAVTMGPGLEPALWVGINFAKTLSLIWKSPVIPINHMEGHILSSLLNSDHGNVALPEVTFPAIALLVSGGHTELIYIGNWGEYKLIGATRDDAVGEAFDKVARLLGMPYPGGPAIAKLATEGSPNMFSLPRPMLNSPDYDFSFAGLKTAVRYLIDRIPEMTHKIRSDIAREFEDAAVEVLVKKSLRAMSEFQAKTFILGGGVSANLTLRNALKNALLKQDESTLVFMPDLALSTDNALMIAVAGYLKGAKNSAPLKNIIAQGGWKVSEKF